MKYLLSFLLVIFSVTSLLGQSTSQKELKIGDIVPDIEFKMFNYSSPTAHLSDFKGKFVILDFWTSWCLTCIESMPGLDSLQKIYKDKLVILLVNSGYSRDDLSKVNKIFSKINSRMKTPLLIPSAYNDTIARAMFPHTAVPHDVWIGSDGIVKAITSSNEITGNNIEIALSEKAIDLPQKIDLFYSRPMYLGENLDLGKLEQYSLFIKGKLEGLEPIYSPRFGSGADGRVIIRGYAFRNCSLLDIYKAAYHFNNEMKNLYPPNRILLEVKEPSSFLFDSSKSKMSREHWEKDHEYSFDFVIPISRVDSIYDYMLSDINHYSGFYGRVEKRKVSCFVLVKSPSWKDKRENTAEPNAGKMDVFTMNSITNLLNMLQQMHLPFVNEVEGEHQIAINMSTDLINIDSLKACLKNYDIEIIKGTRVIDMFVISDGTKTISK